MTKHADKVRSDIATAEGKVAEAQAAYDALLVQLSTAPGDETVSTKLLALSDAIARGKILAESLARALPAAVKRDADELRDATRAEAKRLHAEAEAALADKATAVGKLRDALAALTAAGEEYQAVGRRACSALHALERLASTSIAEAAGLLPVAKGEVGDIADAFTLTLLAAVRGIRVQADFPANFQASPLTLEEAAGRDSDRVRQRLGTLLERIEHSELDGHGRMVVQRAANWQEDGMAAYVAEQARMAANARTAEERQAAWAKQQAELSAKVQRAKGAS